MDIIKELESLLNKYNITIEVIIKQSDVHTSNDAKRYFN